jgi:hypothetical protein
MPKNIRNNNTMNKLLRLSAFVIIPFLFMSCQESKRSDSAFSDIDTRELIKTLMDVEGVYYDPYIISFNEIEEGKELLLSEVVDSVWYLKLDNSPEAILGGIDKIILTDNHILVLDRYKTKSIKMFDLYGKFIQNIGNIGKGPDEYIEPTDFIHINNKLIVFDQFTHKLLHFTMDGSMIYIKKAPFRFHTFFAFNENELAYQVFDSDNSHFPEINGYSLIWSDSLFNIKQRGINVQTEKYPPRINKGLMNSYEGLKLINPFCDTIYSVHANGKFSPEYFIDFNQNAMPEHQKLRIRNQSKFAMLHDCFSTENILYFTFSKNNRLYHCFYSKMKKSFLYFNTQLNDISPLFAFENILTNYNNNSLIGFNYAHSITERYNLIKSTNHFELINEYQHFEEVKLLDNIILVFYRLKN